MIDQSNQSINQCFDQSINQINQSIIEWPPPNWLTGLRGDREAITILFCKISRTKLTFCWSGNQFARNFSGSGGFWQAKRGCYTFFTKEIDCGGHLKNEKTLSRKFRDGLSDSKVDISTRSKNIDVTLLCFFE